MAHPTDLTNEQQLQAVKFMGQFTRSKEDFTELFNITEASTIDAM